MIRPLLASFFLLGACVSRAPLLATSLPLAPVPKVGKSCEYVLLRRFVLSGYSDIMSAAKQGQIETISVVDSETTSYLLWSKVCTVVYGT